MVQGSAGFVAPTGADGPVLTLETTTLRAEPGGQTQTTIRLRNPGQLVESFRLDVVGLEAGWWQIHPPELALYPGQEASAVVLLTPPAQARAPDRPMPFAVRAVSTIDPGRSVAEEGDLEVGRVFDLQPAIVPVTSRARWSAKHTITFTNWGNAPVRLRLSVTDKDQRLGFNLTPEVVAVPMGGTATARLRVRPRRPFLRGAPVTLPFQVKGESPDPPFGGEPAPRSVAARAGVPDPTKPVLDAAVLQRPILSRGVMVVAGLLVAALAAMVALVLRADAVQGARDPDAPPEAPTNVTVAPVGAELVRVAWTASDRATGYRVDNIDEASGKALEPQLAKPGATLVEVEAEPRTRMCFAVVALRGNRDGPRSDVKCTSTPDDSLPPPVDVAVTSAQNGAFQVSWSGNKRHEHVVLLDGASKVEVAAGVSKVPLEIPAGEHCVSVLARRGEKQASPPSTPEECVEGTATATTAPPGAGQPSAPGQPSAGGQPGGQPPGGQPGEGNATPTPAGGTGLTGWVAWIAGPYLEQSRAEAARQSLVTQGVVGEVVVVPANRFPSLQFSNPQALLVVVAGFATQEAAQAHCTGLPPLPTPPPGANLADCQALQADG